jgi:lysophospholipase L1-like esterase
MKRISPPIILLLILWTRGMCVSAEPAPFASLRTSLESGETPVKIVCFGDSVTGFYYHTGSARAYSSLLGEFLTDHYPKAKLEVINAGMSGHTTVNGLARIEKDVIFHRPALVTVMFGLNDVVRTPPDLFRKNLITILTKCRNAGSEVLLCTPNAVLTTADRPVEKVAEYAKIVRAVAGEYRAPLCDLHQTLSEMKQHDPEDWRLCMSDEIHPNLRGHRRIAAALAGMIVNEIVPPGDQSPPSPPLLHTLAKLRKGEPVKVLAMPPFDALIDDALKISFPDSRVNVTRWETDGLSGAQLMKDAARRVRPFAPDLVIVSAPRSAVGETREEYIRTRMWITNNSLSRGKREWDVLVVHPDVVDSAPAERQDAHDALLRIIVPAQDLSLLDRSAGDDREPGEILSEWVKKNSEAP